jgi:hypothetical protein
VTGQVTETEVEVAVRDQGVGIPADQLPLIFTKFYRRTGHGSPGGTGLGLFIARGLVEAHAGRIPPPPCVGGAPPPPPPPHKRGGGGGGCGGGGGGKKKKKRGKKKKKMGNKNWKI